MIHKTKIRSSALFITITYLIIGILWITISGKAVEYFTEGSDHGPMFELFKGLFFIVSTSLILYFMINRREKIREKLEDEIKESEEKWKNIYDNANDPIFLIDKNYMIIEANSKASALYGFTQAEFIKMQLVSLHEYNDENFIKMQMDNALKGFGSSYEINHRKKDGSLFPVEVSIKAVIKADSIQFIQIVHDLSIRKEIEKKLISSESKYRTLVETSHELIWATDPENVITFVNNASRKIYGLEPEEMIGKKFTDFATSEQIDEDKKAMIDSALSGREVLQYESRITDSNGKEKHLLTNCIVNKSPEGMFQGMFGTSLDITERFESGERIKYHNRVYSLLTNMNQLIVRASDKEQILTDACRLAVEYGHFKMAWIGIVDEKTGNVIPAYKYGEHLEYLEKISISVNENESTAGPIVRAFRDNIYYVSNDVENDALLRKWKDETIKMGFRAFAVFPIEIKNKVVAVYNIYSEKKQFFGSTETELLLELAEDISFALEYIELENQQKIIEDRYKNIVEKAPVGIYTHLEGKITYINPEGFRMLGASSYKEIIGKDIFDIIQPEFKKIVQKRLEDIDAGKTAPELEEKFRKVDGSEIDVMVLAIPYSNNGVKGAQVFFRDLTEQKRAQREILEMNERFSLITRATNDALWDWDLQTDEIWWNEGFKDLFGYKDSEIEKTSVSWTSRIHDDDKERILTGVNNAINSGHEFWFDEYSFRKKDGTYAYVFDRSYIIKDDNGIPCRMVGSMIDITYRRKMENELKESEEKWRSLFENSPSLIFTVDKNVKVTGINRSLSTRIDRDEIIGTDGYALIHTDEIPRIKEIIKKIFTSGIADSFTVKSAENDGGNYYSVQAVPQLRDNIIEGITFIATDITEKIRSEEKIRVTNQKLHALAAHLQTIREEERTMISREIHDQLGQELTALKMDIAFLSRKIDKIRLTGKDEWDELSKGLKSMSEITDQTIASIRRIARELRPDVLDKLGLKEAIEWQAEEFTKRTGIDCIVSLPSSDFNFDRLLENTIFRIVQESLTNVARHSQATRSKISISITVGGICVSIEDNGKGITQEEIDNAKSLGLVGIKERAYSVNGKLSIEGKKDKGTILKILIPLNKNE